MDLAKRLRAFRESREPKLSQADLAGLLGCTHQAVSQLEGGQRPGRSLLRSLMDSADLALTVEERRALVAWVLGVDAATLGDHLGLDDDAPTEAA